LPEIVDQHRAEIDDVKRTPALSFEVDGETDLVVAGAFPGQAAEQQGYYALIGHKPARADLGSVLANTSARDLRWSAFPWLSLVGALLAMIAIGLFLQRYEVEWPIERMRTELRRLSKGEIARLDDHRFGGHFGGIARDVNAALDHAGASISQVGVGAGGADGNAAIAESARIGGPPAGLAPPAPAASRGAVPAPGSLFGNAPGPMDGFAPPPPPGFAPPGATAYAPPSLPAPPLPPGVRTMGRVPAPSSAPASPAFRPAEPRTAPAMAAPTEMATAAAFAASASGSGTGVVSSSDPTSPTQTDSEDDDEMHVRAVYGEFINAKQQCGESVAGLTLDKFRLRLQENRNSLMARHACRTVRFAVYVKDGKASLRASPVK
jgi:hypothetical protein